ncbi:hypothetical protein C2S51_034028 [Perilla frutescens var. frutescens]|nr:hypothetical protein C2S51_034028 [Perilla frutescens var. frutescens]
MSSLPKEILQHIISMVSFKEAVQTSALSTSWRSLMSPSCVHIDMSNSTIHDQLLPIIKSLSESGNGFQTLKVYLGSSDVALAVCTKGVHGELNLDFYCYKQQKLSVVPLPREYCFSLIVEQSRFCSFSSVKILHLRSVSHLVGDVVSDLCSRCLALESLKIEKCSGLESIEIKSGLKNLEMGDCGDIVRVVVWAHNLTSFSYKGVFPNILQLLNVPNLVDVSFNFGDGLGRNNTFDCEDALSLLSSVKDIQTLKITTWLIQTLCCAGVIFNKLDFQFSRLKKLELIICSKISSQTRDSFACFLHTAPSLEELFLKKEVEQSAELPFTYQHWHEPHLWKDYATVKNDACRLKYMKKIRIVGFTMEKDELLWMDLLLHNAINLKEMILDHSWRVAIIPLTHLPYIKLQYILLPCPHIHSYFVLIADSPP